MPWRDWNDFASTSGPLFSSPVINCFCTELFLFPPDDCPSERTKVLLRKDININ